jgi:hypothetical protein
MATVVPSVDEAPDRADQILDVREGAATDGLAVDGLLGTVREKSRLAAMPVT